MRGRTLTIKEQTRLQILNGVLERRWSMPKAAELLGVSERHAWRLLAAYREEGAAALAHGNRGRLPANATPAATRQQVVRLAQERYGGINHTHLTELLAEREGIVLSRSTLRRVLVGAGQPSPRHRRPPHHRCRRQRMPQEGMLLQLDGSPHAWLEARGPWLTLWEADPVWPCSGRAGGEPGLCPQPRGERASGAGQWHFPGPAGSGATLGRCQQPGGGQPGPGNLPAPLQ